MPASALLDLAAPLVKEWQARAPRWGGTAEQARRAGPHAWNPPLDAAATYRKFLSAYPRERGAILLLGLNPGPHGMAQTGIPFTDCRTAKSRLGLDLCIPGHAPDDLSRW